MCYERTIQILAPDIFNKEVRYPFFKVTSGTSCFSPKYMCLYESMGLTTLSYTLSPFGAHFSFTRFWRNSNSWHVAKGKQDKSNQHETKSIRRNYSSGAYKRYCPKKEKFSTLRTPTSQTPAPLASIDRIQKYKFWRRPSTFNQSPNHFTTSQIWRFAIPTAFMMRHTYCDTSTLQLSCGSSGISGMKQIWIRIGYT